MDKRIAAAIINFQTPDLLEVAVRSFIRHYPAVQLLIIDNGSKDRSPLLVEQLQKEHGDFLATLFLEENIYHGPAMHLAMERLDSTYVFLLDSDTETTRGGFLELMAAQMEASEYCYGIGQVVHVNKRGFAVEDGIPVLSSAHMLLKRAVYQELPPFIHHGLPTLYNFKAAAKAGYSVQSFPIQEYVKHFGRGTAARFGYGLGLRSRLDFLLNKIGI